MGMDASSDIVFGVLLKTDDEGNYPWGDDLDEWWLTNVRGYKPPFEIYDEAGNYLIGMNNEKRNETTMIIDWLLKKNIHAPWK